MSFLNIYIYIYIYIGKIPVFKDYKIPSALYQKIARHTWMASTKNADEENQDGGVLRSEKTLFYFGKVFHPFLCNNEDEIS